MVRHWRQGRAVLTYGEMLSEAYAALFTGAVIAAMAISTILDLRGMADATCAGACVEVRAFAPWAFVLVLAVLGLGLARLLGPVFSPPAANTWLLSAPVDRAALLRPTWWWTVAITLAGSGVLLLGPVLLSGGGSADAGAVALAGVAAALASVALAATSQVNGGSAARRTTWLLVAALWTLLALAATGRRDVVPVPSQAAALGIGAVLAVAAVLLVAFVTTRLRTVSRRTLGQTAHLPAALSGSLASLDLGLMYDVLLTRRWSGDAHVRSRTGGPRGARALLHRDLRRALRSPQPFVVLAGMLLVVHASAAADVGRAVVLVATLAGLVSGPALASGLRVVVRTQSLTRMLPFSEAVVRSTHAVVPGVALLLYGFAGLGVLLPLMPAVEAVTVALAVGLSSFAATLRWVAAPPPNYAAPMLATPAGAMPPGVFGSLIRGIDIWVLTAVPLLFSGFGVYVSLAISGVVISYLLTAESKRP